VKIYRSAFLLDEPLEFWAEVDCLGSYKKQRAQDASTLRSLIETRDLNLSFLRTCRRIHAEGSEVFYGENEFRFSGVSRHMIANLFVRKIYKQHFQWLTTLTIAMPFHNTYSSQSIWRSRRYTYNDPNDALPFSEWRDCWFEFDAAFEHLVWNLVRAERFTKLRLLLPHDYECDTGGAMTSSIGKDFRKLLAAKSSLHLEIVRMYREHDLRVDLHASESEAWKAVGLPRTHVALIDMFKKLVEETEPKQGKEKAKCTVVAAYTDGEGKWKVVKGVREDALLPLGAASTKEAGDT
jgi:hypothetical protein